MTQKQQYSTDNTFTPAWPYVLPFSEEGTEWVKEHLCCHFHSAFPCPTLTWPLSMAVRGSKRTGELAMRVGPFSESLLKFMELVKGLGFVP